MERLEKIDFECALRNYKEYWEHHIDRDLSDYKIVKLALEKQISKKPTYICDNFFICKECESHICWVDEKETHKYCLSCGQKLDWD